MSRDERVFLEDILVAAERIGEYLVDVDRARFKSTPMIQDAVVRNLEVIGEAVKSLSDATREAMPTVEWRKIAGMRDILAHEYFGVELEIVWEAAIAKVPEAAAAVREHLEAAGS